MTGQAHLTEWTLTLAVALFLGMETASAAVPANSNIPPMAITEAKRVLQVNGYADIAVLGGDDLLVTVSVVKDGKKSVVDVDPLTQIILPHVDLPPVPAQLAPVTEWPKPR